MPALQRVIQGPRLDSRLRGELLRRVAAGDQSSVEQGPSNAFVAGFQRLICGPIRNCVAGSALGAASLAGHACILRPAGGRRADYAELMHILVRLAISGGAAVVGPAVDGYLS